jgi:hypothetical protein
MVLGPWGFEKEVRADEPNMHMQQLQQQQKQLLGSNRSSRIANLSQPQQMQQAMNQWCQGDRQLRNQWVQTT